MDRILNKKFVGMFAGLVVTLCFLVAFSAPWTAKRSFILAPTATTVGTQTQDIGFLDVSPFDNSVISVQARVGAIDLNSGDSKTFTREAGFEIIGGVLSKLGHLTPNEFEAGDPHTGNWEITANCDDITDRIFFRLKGSANTTIEWRVVASIHLYQP